MIAFIGQTSELKGSVPAPPSKSYTHRALIAATLTRGETHIESPLFCKDTEATMRACRSLGAEIVASKGSIFVNGPLKLRAPDEPIDCRESGSTMRFLTPVAALAEGTTVLTGGPSLLRRPVGPLVDALQDLGVDCNSTDGYPPVIVKGGLAGGRTSIVGDVSSQFITGLLLACPLAEDDTEIHVSTPLESKPYVRLTLSLLRKHGVTVNASSNLRSFRIPGQQHYAATDHKVPGDYSSAAFLMAAAAITSSSVIIGNLTQEPDQPDREILSILRRMGARVEAKATSVYVEGRSLRGVEVDCRDIPDLVPVTAALGCKAAGVTRILKAGRLRLKESDRLESVTELRKFGAVVEQRQGTLTVEPPPQLRGAKVDPHGDHRIAMACTLLGLAADGETLVLGAECVDKSYPGFFEDIRRLGGSVAVR